MRASIASLCAALLVTSAAGIAQARDVCIGGFPNSNYVVVCKNFSVPGRNACKPCIGFNLIGALDGLPFAEAATGTGCFTGDGTRLFFTITDGSVEGGFTETDDVVLTKNTGAGYGTVISGDGNGSPSTSDFANTGEFAAFCTGNVANVAGNPSQPPRPGNASVAGSSKPAMAPGFHDLIP